VVPINLVRFQANQALTLTVGNWPHRVLMLDGARKLPFQKSAFGRACDERPAIIQLMGFFVKSGRVRMD
jgi:hypothetical protein